MEHEQESKADVESPPARINESVSEDSTLDEKRERLLIRKIDYHILPLVVLLYLFSFLDRVNIGNARLYGLEEDLGLVGNQYQVAVSILFVTYCVRFDPYHSSDISASG
jgi:Zn-finger domain-containing protein